MNPHVHGEECGLIDLPALESDRRPRARGRTLDGLCVRRSTGGSSITLPDLVALMGLAPWQRLLLTRRLRLSGLGEGAAGASAPVRSEAGRDVVFCTSRKSALPVSGRCFTGPAVLGCRTP